MQASGKPINETRLVSLVALIQFIFVVEFMMVAPLGPDFSLALNADNADIGLVVSSYTVAAAIASILLAKILDRFDRKLVIMFFLGGLSLSTFGCAMSGSISELITYRFLAGLFGGPAATIAVSMIIDVVPESRRGKAIGIVMSAFSISSILGIPIGLELSHRGGWELPFIVVSVLIILTIILLLFMLPTMKTHLDESSVSPSGKKLKSFTSLFYRPEALVAYFMTMASMMAAFFIVPNIAAFMQFNLQFPRESYGTLYFVGGAISLLIMRYTGKWIDQFDIRIISLIASLGIALVLFSGVVVYPVLIPAAALFILYMATMSMRNVVSVSICSMVPDRHERAAFTSINQSISHLSAAAGAFIGSIYLSSDEAGNLVGMNVLGLWALILSLVMPFCVYYLSSYVDRKAL